MSAPDLVIITADVPYSDNWHTPVQYAEFLSGRLKVLYIDPPRAWQPLNFFKPAARPRKINDHLTVIGYRNKYPSRWKRSDENFLEKQVLRFIESTSSVTVLFWQFDPFRSAISNIKSNARRKVRRIYHVIDPFMHNPLDATLAAQAQLVLVSSKQNLEHYKKYGRKVKLQPQSLDLELTRGFLARNTTKELPARFLTLLGTISDDVDLDFLQNLARTGVELVLIGKKQGLNKKRKQFKELLAHEKVHYLGLLHPRAFYPVLKKSIGGLVLYERHAQKGRAVLKVLHYIAAGIPVISNADCELGMLEGRCIYTAWDDHQLMQYAEKALQGQLPFDHAACETYLENASIARATEQVFAWLEEQAS